MRLLLNQPLGLCPQGVPKKCSDYASYAGPVLGGIFGLIGTGMEVEAQEASNRRNIEMQRETNEQNYKIHQEQLDYAREAYKRELEDNRADAALARQQYLEDREYDSPANKMQRLRAAGLNPYLNYGDGNYGTGMVQSNSASMSMPQAPQMVAPHVQPVTAYGDMGRSMSSMMLALSDLSFREDSNKREWIKALANSPLDPSTKDKLAKAKVFEDDEVQDNLKEGMIADLQDKVNNQAWKEADRLFTLEMQQNQRDVWKRDKQSFEQVKKQWPIAFKTAQQTFANLQKQGRLYDKEGQLKDGAIKILREELTKIKDFKENTPEWMQTFLNVIERIFGGPIGKLMTFLK